MTDLTAAHAMAGRMLAAATDMGVHVITVEASMGIAHPDAPSGVGLGARINVRWPREAEALAERLGVTAHAARTVRGHTHHAWTGVLDGVLVSITAVDLTGDDTKAGA